MTSEDNEHVKTYEKWLAELRALNVEHNKILVQLTALQNEDGEQK